MTKAQVKLDLRTKAVPTKVQFARQIVTGMTGNANFTTPNPALTAVTTAAADLEKAYNDAQTARDVAKAKTAVQSDKEMVLDTILTNLGNYVEGIANGNPTIIKSAGLEVRGENGASAAAVSTKATSLSASVGDKPGEVDLHWDSVAKARSYEVQYCLDPVTPTAWVHAGVSTKSQFTVSNLESVKKYWFRVAPVSADGQGAWSDPVAKVTQ